MGNNELFKILPKSREVIAEAGDWSLVETVFTIEKAFDDLSENLLTITHQSLLPDQTQNGYISISQAAKLTGLGEHQLEKLCVKGIITAKKEKGHWMILLESLNKYTSS